jgi:tRNA pseudouridine55 synthase
MLGAFLNLYKPAGITAHGCVARVRKLLNQKKMGHSGTLDPAATGVLPIAIGKATRLLRFLPTGKAYQATVQFGITTDTDDLDGEILSQHACPELSLAQIEALLPHFLGQIQQYPPAYSAIKVKGKRLYELARAGQQVEVPIRTVEIKSLQVLNWRSGEFPQLDLAIDCGTGTYIRSIARDIGAKLGCGATLAKLERTQSNGFSLATSVTFNDLAGILEAGGTIDQYLIAPDQAISGLEAVQIGHKSAKRWCQGQAIPIEMVISTTDMTSSEANVDRRAALTAQEQVNGQPNAPKLDPDVGEQTPNQPQGLASSTIKQPESAQCDPVELTYVRVYTRDRDDAQTLIFLGVGKAQSEVLVPEVVLRKFNFEAIS